MGKLERFIVAVEKIAAALSRAYPPVAIIPANNSFVFPEGVRRRKPARRNGWTATQEADLKRLRAKGLKFTEIAKRVGHTKSACSYHLWKLEHPNR